MTDAPNLNKIIESDDYDVRKKEMCKLSRYIVTKIEYSNILLVEEIVKTLLFLIKEPLDRLPHRYELMDIVLFSCCKLINLTRTDVQREYIVNLFVDGEVIPYLMNMVWLSGEKERYPSVELIHELLIDNENSKYVLQSQPNIISQLDMYRDVIFPDETHFSAQKINSIIKMIEGIESGRRIKGIK